MDSGQFFSIVGRLSLGALASFLAIMLWSKIRDAAWMFIVIGTLTAYTETVYSILGLFGISGESVFAMSSLAVVSVVLPCLPVVFFIAAFAVMIVRKYRKC
jgi:hypothetical protein